MKESPQHELLSAYLDGAVSDEERAQVEQWLADDSAACRTLDELRAVGASLASLPKLEIGEDLSDRVLRAAERHILSEPTRLADPPPTTPRAAPVSFRAIARRLVTSRGLVRSGMAVAIAVMLTVFQLRSPEVRQPIAKMSEAPTSSVTSAPVIGPVDDSPPFESSNKGLSYASDSSAAEAMAETGRAEPKSAPILTPKARPEALAPRAKKARAEAAAPAENPPSPKAAATWFAETVERQSGVSPRTAQTSDAKAAGADSLDTPVARAVRNPAEVLVVDCRFSPSALEDDAFGRTLAAHGIEIVETPDVEEPLARRLVENVAQASPEFGTVRRGEPESGVARRPGGAGGRQAALQVGKPPTYAPKRSAAYGYVDTAADADVEFVLVEGSPSQIAATIGALRRRGDATVSVAPRQQQAWLDQTLEDGRSRFDAAIEAAKPAEPQQADARGREVAKGEASDRSDRRAGVADKESHRALERPAALQQALSQTGDAMQIITPPRATAQRLGRMALPPTPPTANQQAQVEPGRQEKRIDQKPSDSAGLLAEGSIQLRSETKQESATAMGLAPASRYQVESRDGKPRLQQVLFVLHRMPLAEPARAAASAEADTHVARTREAAPPDAAPAEKPN